MSNVRCMNGTLMELYILGWPETCRSSEFILPLLICPFENIVMLVSNSVFYLNFTTNRLQQFEIQLCSIRVLFDSLHYTNAICTGLNMNRVPDRLVQSSMVRITMPGNSLYTRLRICTLPRYG